MYFGLLLLLFYIRDLEQSLVNAKSFQNTKLKETI